LNEILTLLLASSYTLWETRTNDIMYHYRRDWQPKISVTWDLQLISTLKLQAKLSLSPL